MHKRVAVVSHATIDHIFRDGIEVVTVGGPICYSGLMVKHCMHDLIPITKVGNDFLSMNVREVDYILSSKNALSDKPTTRFRLVIDSSNARRLFLLKRCEDISYDDVAMSIRNGLDACIVSPVINEISIDIIRLIASTSGFTILDPQGLVRRVMDDGSIVITSSMLDVGSLSIDALKVDHSEAYALTSLYGLDALNRLSNSCSIAILTIDNNVLMSYNGNVYRLTIDMVDNSIDSTGVGDIFTAAYTLAYIEDRDALWALCYAASASYIALTSNRFGIYKVPYADDVERYAYILEERVRD
jgi:sugar/nucleoside kinase (ribokinase family)